MDQSHLWPLSRVLSPNSATRSSPRLASPHLMLACHIAFSQRYFPLPRACLHCSGIVSRFDITPSKFSPIGVQTSSRHAHEAPDLWQGTKLHLLPAYSFRRESAVLGGIVKGIHGRPTPAKCACQVPRGSAQSRLELIAEPRYSGLAGTTLPRRPFLAGCERAWAPRQVFMR